MVFIFLSFLGLEIFILKDRLLNLVDWRISTFQPGHCLKKFLLYFLS